MRLINTRTLQLSQFFERKIPEYAILSHTWEEREVTFEEWACAFSSPSSTTFTIWSALKDVVGPGVLEDLVKKPGYRKVYSAAQEAQRRGFEWIWCDTCCIDKSSTAELSEAINSMYKWYQRAAICFAYLSDVGPFLKPMERSRWFSRGWTLQELLAPEEIIFFDADWGFLGNKTELKSELSRICRIHIDAFETHRGLKRFSVAQRMSWIARREVSREEDIAYCLLGIFAVNIPLMYGEGGFRAFRRLQEEIMGATIDLSIFAWSDPEDPRQQLRPAQISSSRHLDLESQMTSAFAGRPRAFELSNTVDKTSEPEYRMYPTIITNIGIRMFLRIRPSADPEIFEALLCVWESFDRLGKAVVLPLALLNRSSPVAMVFARLTGSYRWREIRLTRHDLLEFELREILFLTKFY
jgi:hypothetical protein